MLSREEVQHIAELARVGLSEEELVRFSKDLSSILDWIEQLKEVDISKAEAISHVTGLNSVMREDSPEDFSSKEGIAKLFPEEKSGYDKVKSVL